MTRTALWIPLALLGMTSTAFAGIDDVAASMMDGHEEASPGHDHRQERTTSTTTRTRGNKSVTRQTASSRSGHKQARRTTYSNGNKSHTTGHARSRSTSSSSSSHANGDRHGRRTTELKARSYTKTTNGNKTVTSKRGTNLERTQRRGVQDGTSYRHTEVDGVHRTRARASNERSGRTVRQATRTTGQRETSRSGGQKVIDRATTTRQVRSRDSHPARPNVTLPSGRSPRISTRPGTSRGHVERTTLRSSTRPSGPTRSTVVTRPTTRTTRVTTHRPRTTSVVRRRTVTYTSVRPYHGVFVYGPAPVHHHHYHSSGPAQVRTQHMPERAVDRTNSVAVGLKMGSLTFGYADGPVYSDLGLGLAGRYRPAESVGLQLDLSHHSQSWSTESERSQTMAAGNVQLFAFPWTRVSPYVLGGVTYDARNLHDDIATGNGSATVIANDGLWGLHAGLGLELALGQNLALDFEGRYIGYLDKSPTDPSLPGALQLTGGLMVHF